MSSSADINPNSHNSAHSDHLLGALSSVGLGCFHITIIRSKVLNYTNLLLYDLVKDINFINNCKETHYEP